MSKGLRASDLRKPRFYSYEMYVPTRKRVHVKENKWSDPATQVWPQNLFLCKYLEMRAEGNGLEAFQGTTVLELGSGCGLVGMVAALLGASVTVSDLGKGLPLLQHNVEAFRAEWKNQVQIGCDDTATMESRFSLEESGRGPPFNIVICSDVWAERELRRSFLLLLLKAVAADSEVLMCHTWRNPDSNKTGPGSAVQEQRDLMTRLSHIFDVEEIETEDTIRAYCRRLHGGSYFLRSQSTIDIQESSDAEGRITILRLTCRQAIKDNPALLEEELKREIALHRQRSNTDNKQDQARPSIASAAQLVEAKKSDRSVDSSPAGTALPQLPTQKRLLSVTYSSDDPTRSGRGRVLRQRVSSTVKALSVSSRDISTKGVPPTVAGGPGAKRPVTASSLRTKTSRPSSSVRKSVGGSGDSQSGSSTAPAKEPLTSLSTSSVGGELAIACAPSPHRAASRQRAEPDRGETRLRPASGAGSPQRLMQRTPSAASRGIPSNATGPQRKVEGRPPTAVTSTDATLVPFANDATTIAKSPVARRSHPLPQGRQITAAGARGKASADTNLPGRSHVAAGGDSLGAAADHQRPSPSSAASRSLSIASLAPSTGSGRRSSVDRYAAALAQKCTAGAGEQNGIAPTAVQSPLAIHLPPRSGSPSAGLTPAQRTSALGAPDADTGPDSACQLQGAHDLPATGIEHRSTSSRKVSGHPALAAQKPTKTGLVGRLSSLLRRPDRAAAATGRGFGDGAGAAGVETDNAKLRRRSASRTGGHLKKPSSSTSAPAKP
ncbi:hypothetical protein BESB_078360 [Besnoitia besnoiti]|uniref:Methyltransferase n=1 Tax=Besnoitia besnoiti TaxID=94643 RepID=A0A2A9ME11_BESBE|nr:hypothetical protein BESB_078360 [Besnoitia besnoiti]PFH33620.1 hypothetical protein BESB_078360 [Besnoitia besnoiti]